MRKGDGVKLLLSLLVIAPVFAAVDGVIVNGTTGPVSYTHLGFVIRNCRLASWPL